MNQHIRKMVGISQTFTLQKHTHQSLDIRHGMMEMMLMERDQKALQSDYLLMVKWLIHKKWLDQTGTLTSVKELSTVMEKKSLMQLLKMKLLVIQQKLQVILKMVIQFPILMNQKRLQRSLVKRHGMITTTRITRDLDLLQ